MTDPQQDSIDLLESQGYELETPSIWPVYRNPETGSYVQVAFDGRIIPRGFSYGKSHEVLRVQVVPPGNAQRVQIPGPAGDPEVPS
jgi:hypothetical protein